MLSKKQFFGVLCPVFLCFLFSQIFSFANIVNSQEDFYITESDIKNAVPTPKEVNLTKKNNHDLEVMEQRHFGKIYDYDEPKYRVAKLEQYLLKRTWEYSNLQDRMNRLKLASQRKMLAGTSIPPSLRQHFSPKRIQNDSTPTNENEDNLGLIDGLLKLYAPDIYYGWSEHKRRMYDVYDNDG